VVDEPGGVSTSQRLRLQFGDIDIYLFDQILRGRFDTRRRVLDAGCGDGRNLIYFLQNGFDCFGVDSSPEAIAVMRQTAAALAPALASTNFAVADLRRLPFDDAAMQAVVCSAVLHFADDEAHLTAMVDEMWRVLAPQGLLFARLASNIGLEAVIGPARRQVRLPDGTDRFVVDEALLLDLSARLGGRLADPIKTTNVQGRRAMTTWVLLKG
jgi:SAM-dependent methyltransferase